MAYEEILTIKTGVVGPSTATGGHIAVFDDNTGKVIKDSGFTIGKSVPSDAKFTDTNTKVTSVDNHYSPSANSNAVLSVDASSTTSATWGSTSLVTGVNLQRDAKGHVTGVTVDSIRMPVNPNTDTKNTAGSTDTSSKIYLVGATSQAANPQTYSDNEIYATSGVLTTKKVQVGGTAATIEYDSTNKCINFVFA